MWKNLNVVNAVLGRLFAAIAVQFTVYLRRKVALRTYSGAHRRDPKGQYEKRYDLKLAQKALGRWFEMPMDYVY